MGERERGLIYLFNKCYEKYGNEDIKNIRFNCNDRGNENGHSEYSMCYNKNNPNLKKYSGPDWVFWHWPSANITQFEDTKNEIISQYEKYPNASIHKVGWVGNIYSPLCDVIEYKTRPLLKKIGDENPELFEIFHVGPLSSGKIDNTIPNYLSLSELIKYKYLIDIGGNGYSGRLKFLMFSRRPLLIVDRNYIEYFYDELIPYKHYIPVKMDLSDLLDQVNWMISNPDKSLEIANNAFDYAINNFKIDNLVDRIYYVYKNLQ
jgi:hypothetical protein